MSRQRPQSKPAEDASRKPVPEPASDVHTMRRALAEKLEAFVREDAWQRCTRPACKRARACRAIRATCEGLPEQPEPTPEQWEKTKFNLQRALKRRLAELGAGK
jgi:hypothetical protein